MFKAGMVWPKALDRRSSTAATALDYNAIGPPSPQQQQQQSRQHHVQTSPSMDGQTSSNTFSQHQPQNMASRGRTKRRLTSGLGQITRRLIGTEKQEDQKLADSGLADHVSSSSVLTRVNEGKEDGPVECGAMMQPRRGYMKHQKQKGSLASLFSIQLPFVSSNNSSEKDGQKGKDSGRYSAAGVRHRQSLSQSQMYEKKEGQLKRDELFPHEEYKESEHSSDKDSYDDSEDSLENDEGDEDDIISETLISSLPSPSLGPNFLRPPSWIKYHPFSKHARANSQKQQQQQNNVSPKMNSTKGKEYIPKKVITSPLQNKQSSPKTKPNQNGIIDHRQQQQSRNKFPSPSQIYPFSQKSSSGYYQHQTPPLHPFHYHDPKSILKRNMSAPNNLSLLQARLHLPLSQPQFYAAPNYVIHKSILHPNKPAPDQNTDAFATGTMSPYSYSPSASGIVDVTPLYGYALLCTSMLAFVICTYTLCISKFLPFTGIRWIDAIKADYYYCLLVPITAVASLHWVFWNWLGMKFFRHN
ncbi:hypothetical protein H4219_003848 [Mycoemilia scoparia]|uniref:Uncharacterized protein n=1 Tax=Mycoemilia scoparia TaxID=417184 RepID=A0A9W7ZTX7_9FUNG|nr:hypothetical protein H4219_003848 [Mycoemilia scoparia]